MLSHSGVSQVCCDLTVTTLTYACTEKNGNSLVNVSDVEVLAPVRCDPE
jgi:hypothetical protein